MPPHVPLGFHRRASSTAALLVAARSRGQRSQEEPKGSAVLDAVAVRGFKVTQARVLRGEIYGALERLQRFV